MRMRVNFNEPRAVVILKWFMVTAAIGFVPMVTLTNNVLLFHVGGIRVTIYDLGVLLIPNIALLLIYEVIRAVKQGR